MEHEEAFDGSARPLADLTLEQIDGEDWGEPPAPTHVLTESYRLRKVPLREFRLEDLRLMINTGNSMDVLMPLALQRLSENPLARGDFYVGDLLAGVIRAPAVFWTAHLELFKQAKQIAATALDKITALQELEAAGHYVADRLPPDDMAERIRQFLAT